MWSHRALLCLLSLMTAVVLMATNVGVAAFTIVPPIHRHSSVSKARFAVSNADSLDEIRCLRVKEIKAELDALSISSADAFEKEELVRRLYEARKHGAKDSSSSSSTSSVTVSDGDVVRAPLYFTTMDANKLVSAANDKEIAIEPSDQPYATVQISVVNPSGPDFKLSLLLDTACSGFVLRPSVMDRYNLPKLQTPVTMTGAGGTAQGTGLTQINKFTLEGESYGPLPAAVQDIGGLPSSLDGIVGLSFLSQFACVEMNFADGLVVLYKKERKPIIPDDLEVIAEAEMSLTKLGIWTVDCMLDGRGPVKLLVDSGAASTFLNWKGVSDLSLSRDSPLVEPLTNRMGAMGSDNVAMELTHRLTVRQNVNFGLRPLHSGLAVSGDGVSIDIGDIAVLDALGSDNVGGILGIDVLMQCKMVRMCFNGPIRRITFMK